MKNLVTLLLLVLSLPALGQQVYFNFPPPGSFNVINVLPDYTVVIGPTGAGYVNWATYNLLNKLAWAEGQRLHPGKHLATYCTSTAYESCEPGHFAMMMLHTDPYGAQKLLDQARTRK